MTRLGKPIPGFNMRHASALAHTSLLLAAACGGELIHATAQAWQPPIYSHTSTLEISLLSVTSAAEVEGVDLREVGRKEILAPLEM